MFYAEDFLAGTIYLTNEEIGMYIKLLCKQWTDGHIPKARIRHLIGCPWEDVSDELQDKFLDIPGGDFIFNPRLDQERKKRLAHSEKQRENVMKRWAKNDTKAIPKEYGGNTKTDTKCIPLENEIEIESNKRKGGPGGKEKKEPFEGVLMTQREIELLEERYGRKMALKCMERLGNYKLSTGKKYKSDYRAILSWVVDDVISKSKSAIGETNKKSVMDKIRDKHGITKN